MKAKLNNSQKIARLGLIALAVGIGYSGMRMERKRRARRWREHIQRAPMRSALVTGASAGIGRAYAIQLAGLGVPLVLVARRVERLDALAAEIRSRYGVQVEVLPADLSTEEGIARVEQRILAGGVDFLINNAGYDVFGDFTQIPGDKILGLIHCLELATVRLTRAALPDMLKYRRGAVVNVSSVEAFISMRHDAIYSSSKAFVHRFTESLALEVKDSGVRVQALCPGFTRTEFHDAPEYEPFHIKERIPGWLWMKPEHVVEASLQALGEGRVLCIPGFKNQAIAAVARSGLGQALLNALSGFFPDRTNVLAQPESVLELLACPACHGPLVHRGTARSGTLDCTVCQKQYPIVDGIPRFAAYEDLSGLNRRFAGLYDWFSLVYRLFSKVAFAFIGTTEDQARVEILDRLEPHGRVLEVSIGPGVNLPYLREYPAVSEIHGLDLSNGQLARCRSFAQRRGWQVGLYQGNAEALPFQDNAFDSVLHIGGINFFSDKQKAIHEMIRVAKPGAKIVISDENERGARGFELTLPGFKDSFHGKRDVVTAPVELVPPEMEEVKLDENFWKGWFYCLDFRKPGNEGRESHENRAIASSGSGGRDAADPAVLPGGRGRPA